MAYQHVRAILIAAAAGLCQCLRSTSRRGGSPNVVLILADDLGSNDIGWRNRNNANDIQTPHLDDLAAGGVELTKFYTQHICGPTRASLMSGRYPIHLGLQHANLKPDQENALPAQETTIARELRQLGYVTYGVGKWHLGFWRKEYIPTERGFDHWYGFLQGSEDHFKHTNECGGTSGLDLRHNETPDSTKDGVYSTHLFSEKAADYIDSHALHHASQPLFLYLAYAAVHSPLQAPEERIQRFAHIQDRRRRTYAAMAHLLDEGIFNVTTALNRTGMLENSLIVFCSDNGGQVADGGNNWPLRGWKGSLWEGGMRSPALLFSPRLLGHLQGRRWDGLAHVADVLPTLVALAGGLPPSSSDGSNLLPAILANATSPRGEILHNIDPVGLCPSVFRLPDGAECDADWGVRNAAIRIGPWKLIQGYPGDWPSHQEGWIAPPGWTAPNGTGEEAVAAGRQCGPCIFTKEDSIRRPGEGNCLFNVQDDPEEQCDLAASRPEVVARLLQRLAEYNRSAVPVRYPPGVGSRCSPTRFGGNIQWWAEATDTA